MLCMNICTISGHSEIMPMLPSIHQLKLASLRMAFILRLESLEFLPYSIKYVMCIIRKFSVVENEIIST